MPLKRVVAVRSATYDSQNHVTPQGKQEAQLLATELRAHVRGTIGIFFSTLERDEKEFPATGETARMLASELGVSHDNVHKLEPIGPDRALVAWRLIRFQADAHHYETVIIVTASARAAALVESTIQHESPEPVEGRYRSPAAGEAIVLNYEVSPMSVEMVSIYGAVKVL